MRVSVCFRYARTIYRIAWLNESHNGLYVGVLGGKEDMHASYHQDGRRHYKIGEVYHGQFTDLPISNRRGMRQICHLSLSLSDKWLSTATNYIGDQRTQTIVLLDEASFSCGDRCGLDVWLVDRDAQSDLFEIFCRYSSDKRSFRLVAAIVESLDQFPSHKIALTFSAIG